MGTTSLWANTWRRIKEFHAFNKIPVLGLREGSWLEVNNHTIVLKGPLTARLFLPNKEAEELNKETDLTFLGKLQNKKTSNVN